MTKETAVKASNLLYVIDDVTKFMVEIEMAAEQTEAPLDLTKQVIALCKQYQKEKEKELEAL
ncbi:MAG: hypothetical protein J6A25_01035 [Lachnospiraceae bacterium]|nr:hypothetical protein [Lachnospiraceae bacterium]